MIVPGWARDSRRAATFVVSPRATVPGEAPPTNPTPVCPVLSPTRTSNPSMLQAASTSWAYSRATERIFSAALAARSGSSSWATGTPKYAQIPSPA